MSALRIILGILALGSRAHPSVITNKAIEDFTLSLEPQVSGGFYLGLAKESEERQIIGHIGRTLTSTYIAEDIEGGVSLQVGHANLTVETFYDEGKGAHGVRISWDADASTRLEDCIDFGTKQWYGGPMQQHQIFPIQNAERTYSAYISTENDNGAIVERYWLNSAGEYVYVHPQVPLFVDYNNVYPNHLCFAAQIASPYSSNRNHTELTYDVWFLSDAKQAHQHAVANYLGKPSDVVDYRMVQHPIWSTWAQFSKEIDENNVLEFARRIVDEGFSNSQFEIDDLWEICYGSLTVDTNKFANFTNTVRQIKELGFRVTLWVHPFINKDCEPWYSEALNNSYLVLNEQGSPDTDWWNNNGTAAGYIDFTNPAAAEWWSTRLKQLQATYGIDSFKFDAGESSFAPQGMYEEDVEAFVTKEGAHRLFSQISVQAGDIDLQPHQIVQAYVNECAKFGNMIEVRAGFRTQELPIFVRMVDRDSIWGLNNGLSTIITTALQMNLAGYTFVLPDMIGGNGFNLDHEQADLPTRELFIRWVQANTFLPAMQYSYVPWNFDEETVSISKKYTELHAAYADAIFAAMQASVDEGTPVNAPIWWLDPTDEEALMVWDEYLLGESILVAPVLTEGAVSRDVYLPGGTWLAAGDLDQVYEGPVWIRDYPAPLDTLPYFVRRGEPDGVSPVDVSFGVVALALFVRLILV